MSERKVIVVSGGSKGLGRALLEDFMRHGFSVATFSRSKTDFIDTALSSQADNFYWEQLDITDQDGVRLFVKNVQKHYGRIDGLVNNAGNTLDKVLPLTTDEDIEKTLLINLHATIGLTRQVSRSMLIQHSGSIVNISSILGQRGFTGVSVYSASKAALDGFSRSLARELGSKGIRVNAIAPGFLATDMTHGMAEARKQQIIRRTPLGRLGRVDDIVGLARFLLSDEAKFLTGQSIVVDGGLTC
jgi:3-oxoacyl-[acyl-carrier protein] reductase